MRPIDKSEFPATIFIQNLNTQIANNLNGVHPDYERGVFRRNHYNSVFFGLLYVQKGLCAYTESLLTNDASLLDVTQCFENGVYVNNTISSHIDSDIEHYDPTLKKDYGWTLSNLFLCRVFINMHIKGTKSTLPILKPDNPQYNPINYLRYNFRTHRFVPNPDIEDENERNQIRDQLDKVLGINSEQIISERRNVLNTYKTYIDEGLRTYEYIRDNELKEFFTAYNMSESDLKGLQV